MSVFLQQKFWDLILQNCWAKDGLNIREARTKNEIVSSKNFPLFVPGKKIRVMKNACCTRAAEEKNGFCGMFLPSMMGSSLASGTMLHSESVTRKRLNCRRESCGSAIQKLPIA